MIGQISPNLMPQTHISQILNYLKQGHPVLPPQPFVPGYQKPPAMAQPNMGHYPAYNPSV